MPAETAKALKVPGFSYRGFSVPNLTLGAELIDNLGTGEPAYKLAPQSAPLAWRVGLYMVGRDLAIGEALADGLPDSVKEAGRLVYEDAHRRKASNPSGCWHKDGVLYLKRGEAPKGVMVPEGFVPAKYFKNIEGFGKESDGWPIKPSSQTEEFNVWFPEGGGAFAVPTRDGDRNPDTGTPFETIKDRAEAIKRWTDTGLTAEQAEAELSKFYRKNDGIAAVDSWSYDNVGPLCVYLLNEPGSWNTNSGSFAASSPAERSEAVKNRGFVTVTDAEYKSFVASQKKLDALKKAISE